MQSPRTQSCEFKSITAHDQIPPIIQLSVVTPEEPVRDFDKKTIALLPKKANRQPIEVANLPDALLRLNTVCDVTGLSAATVYRKLREGDFPEPVRLGKRCTRWKSGSIQAWLAAQ